MILQAEMSRWAKLPRLVKDLTSADLMCIVNNCQITKSVQVKAGDKVTLE